MTKKEMRWSSAGQTVARKRKLPTLEHYRCAKEYRWRWEAGQAQPDATYAERLSELAEREHFLKDWKLVGSMTLVGDLESAKAEIAELFRRSVERTASQLSE